MSTAQTGFAVRGRNPDVLTCIANLSNDEVPTPPDLANKMLDTLAEAWAANNDGKNIWSDSNVRFLDPFTKSGVFLREITRRLTDGLIDEIPDLQERVDHILTKQVFGVGITYLTSMLARRSVYCSKLANGPHSIAKSFTTPEGNIWFERMEHTWVGGTEWVLTADQEGNQVKKSTNGKCKYCGASQLVLDRGAGFETHAYAFIHTDDITARIAELFGGDMQFDVIIGNPPYQLGSAGGTRDVPIYQHFVEQAKKLEPRFLSMIIPSRWTAGGLGLDAFRKSMLSDRRISTLVDYPNAAELFPSVGINGGIGYFLWDSQHNGDCSTTLVRDGPHEWMRCTPDDIKTALTELQKVVQLTGTHHLTFQMRREQAEAVDKALGYYNDKGKRRIGWMERDEVPKSRHLIDTWKLLVPQAGSGREREKSGVDLVLGPTLIAAPPSVCTQTYLFVFVNDEGAAASVQSYLRTRFARFLISLRKITQHATRSTYTWVPQQAWDRAWTDADLYEKYGITEDEQASIESLIRPMNSAPAADDE